MSWAPRVAWMQAFACKALDGSPPPQAFYTQRLKLSHHGGIVLPPHEEVLLLSSVAQHEEATAVALQVRLLPFVSSSTHKTNALNTRPPPRKALILEVCYSSMHS